MGFGVAGATGILLVGLAVNVGALAGTYLSVQQGVHEASRASDLQMAQLRGGRIEIINQTYDAIALVLRVNVTNTGGVTYNTSMLDLLLDGELGTTSITAKPVEDVVTLVWPPQTRLEIVATSAQEPESIVVVAPNGVSAFWRA